MRTSWFSLLGVTVLLVPAVAASPPDIPYVDDAKAAAAAIVGAIEACEAMVPDAKAVGDCVQNTVADLVGKICVTGSRGNTGCFSCYAFVPLPLVAWVAWAIDPTNWAPSLTPRYDILEQVVPGVWYDGSSALYGYHVVVFSPVAHASC